MNENQRHDMRQTQRLRTEVAVIMIPIVGEANRLTSVDNKISFYESKILELLETPETTVRNAVIEVLRSRIENLRNPHVEHYNRRMDAMTSFRSQIPRSQVRGNENAGGRTRRRKKSQRRSRRHRRRN